MTYKKSNEPLGILILMATFNSANYIKQQLDSICNQSEPCNLIIHDDGSTDATISIISEYTELPPHITLMYDHQGNMGVPANFNTLLTEAINKGVRLVKLRYNVRCSSIHAWQGNIVYISPARCIM